MKLSFLEITQGRKCLMMLCNCHSSIKFTIKISTTSYHSVVIPIQVLKNTIDYCIRSFIEIEIFFEQMWNIYWFRKLEWSFFYRCISTKSFSLHLCLFFCEEFKTFLCPKFSWNWNNKGSEIDEFINAKKWEDLFSMNWIMKISSWRYHSDFISILALKNCNPFVFKYFLILKWSSNFNIYTTGYTEWVFWLVYIFQP